MSKASSKAIATAVTSWEAGDLETALVALLGAWRETPAPALADAIDAISGELTEAFPPIRAFGSTSATKAWMGLVAEKKPASMGRLLEVLPDSNDRYRRLDAIRELDRDPRVTPFARAWLAKPPVQGANRVHFFTKVIGLLDHTKDVRLLPYLREITTSEERARTIARSGLRSFKPLVALAEALAALDIPLLSAADIAALGKIRARPAATGAGHAAALFARVYADPTDDAARAVLGDVLQQAGDLRGELIALQLARHGTNKRSTTRERALLATWGRKWLGAIEPCVLVGGVVFERGFVARCRYSGGTDHVTAAEWSTVTHIDVSGTERSASGSHELLLQPVARKSIRHVTGLSRADIAILAGKAALPWETMGLELWHWRAVAPLLAGPGATFAAVRKLSILHAMAVTLRDALVEDVAAVAHRWPALTTFEVGMDHAEVAPLARAITTPRVVVRSTIGMTYDFDRATKHLIIDLERVWDECGEPAARVVRDLAGVEHVTITGKFEERDGTLIQGRSRMSLAPILAATSARGVSLRTQSSKASRAKASPTSASAGNEIES